MIYHSLSLEILLSSAVLLTRCNADVKALYIAVRYLLFCFSFSPSKFDRLYPDITVEL